MIIIVLTISVIIAFGALGYYMKSKKKDNGAKDIYPHF